VAADAARFLDEIVVDGEVGSHGALHVYLITRSNV
jgi:hypothetical protein